MFFSEINPRFPFDWKNPSAYLVAFAVEHFLITCASISAVLTTNFVVGIGLIIIAMAKDVKTDLGSIFDRVQNHSEHSQLVIDFKNSIRFYFGTKQLSEWNFSSNTHL